MNELNIDINHVTIRLLSHEPELALQLYLKEFKEKQTTLSDRFHENGNFLEQIDVNKIPPDLLYDFLRELLLISIGKDFKNNEHSNFIPSIFNRLFDMVQTESKDDIIPMINQLIAKIKSISENEENKRNIIYWHKNFSRKCHIELDKEISFRRASRDLNTLMPDLFH